MNCQNCGNPYSSGTTFCSNCGKAIKTKVPTERRKVIWLTLALVGLGLSLAGNALFAKVFIHEKTIVTQGKNELKQCQSSITELSGFSTDVTTRVIDVAVAERSFREESFRMLKDCYQGMTPRETDFDRLSQRYDETTTSWQSVSDYLDAASSSTTTN